MHRLKSTAAPGQAMHSDSQVQSVSQGQRILSMRTAGLLHAHLFLRKWPLREGSLFLSIQHHITRSRATGRDQRSSQCSMRNGAQESLCRMLCTRARGQGACMHHTSTGLLSNIICWMTLFMLYPRSSESSITDACTLDVLSQPGTAISSIAGACTCSKASAAARHCHRIEHFPPCSTVTHAQSRLCTAFPKETSAK